MRHQTEMLIAYGIIQWGILPNPSISLISNDVERNQQAHLGQVYK